MTGTHPAHIPRARAGQFPAQAGPTPDSRAAVSPRSEIMKMNNIADFVLGSASPKAGLTGIENSIGRMNIGSLMSQQDEVNKNVAEITDNTKVRETKSLKYLFKLIFKIFLFSAGGEWQRVPGWTGQRGNLQQSPGLPQSGREEWQQPSRGER